MAKAARHRASSLQRRRAIRDPKRRFLIICEDSNSAPLYFRALGALTNTIIETIGGAGSPEVIVATAIEEAESRGLIRPRRGMAWYERTDEIWTVFDRDQHEHFDEAIELAARNKIPVARSNPCFEIWLILHHQDFEKPDGRHVVFDHLCSLLPEYKAGKGRDVDYNKLIASLESAEKRAEAQLDRRAKERCAFGPPSTTVFQLTRNIRKAVRFK